jgi:hypothetical protein
MQGKWQQKEIEVKVDQQQKNDDVFYSKATLLVSKCIHT